MSYCLPSRQRRLCAVIGAAGFAITLAARASAESYEVLFWLHDDLPGLPGVPIDNISNPRVVPSIDNRGRVAFSIGELGDLPGNANEAIWMGEPGQLSLIVKEGDAIGGGFTYGGLSREPRIMDNGLFWGATILDPEGDATNGGLFLTHAGSTRRIFDEETQLPLPDWADRIVESRGTVYNNAAQAFTRLGLRGPDNNATTDMGAFFYDPSADHWRRVADSEMTAPGTTPAIRVGAFGPLTLSDGGKFAFKGDAFGTRSIDGMSVQQESLLIGDATSLQLLARPGQTPIGGTPSGSLLRGIDERIAINEQGTVAFTGHIARPGLTGGTAVMTATRGGGVQLVAASRDIASSPDGPLEIWSIDEGTTQIAGDGSVFFSAELEVGTFFPRAFIVDRPGDDLLHAIAYEQMQAPGLPPGMIIYQLDALLTNARGTAAFTARIAEFGMTGQSDALFATHDDGTLFKVLAEGETFELVPGDIRTVSAIQLAGPHILNDHGQLVLTLGFTDGTGGMFVTTVPAPPMAALLGVAACCAARRRRPR